MTQFWAGENESEWGERPIRLSLLKGLDSALRNRNCPIFFFFYVLKLSQSKQVLVTDYLNCISRDCSGRCHLCRGGPGKQRLGRILIPQQKPEFRCGSQSLAQTTDSLSVWRLSSSLSFISALSGNSRTSEISFQAFQILCHSKTTTGIMTGLL